MQVDRAWFERDPLEVAPALLGAVLTRHADGVALRITEVEAYRGADDPGAHSYRGKTARNASMFGPGGHLYVYFTYGMHFAMNVVCGAEGEGWGVLLRAGEIVAGREIAERRRLARRAALPAHLASGPGNVAQCFDATRADDGADLLGAAWSLEPTRIRHEARWGARVGVSGPGGDPVAFPWRCWLPGEPSVSKYRAASARRARSEAPERC